jgi:hypothetical protein
MSNNTQNPSNQTPNPQSAALLDDANKLADFGLSTFHVLQTFFDAVHKMLPVNTTEANLAAMGACMCEERADELSILQDNFHLSTTTVRQSDVIIAPLVSKLPNVPGVALDATNVFNIVREKTQALLAVLSHDDNFQHLGMDHLASLLGSISENINAMDDEFNTVLGIADLAIEESTQSTLTKEVS